MHKNSVPEKRTYKVEDIAAMLNIGRTSAYIIFIKEGHLRRYVLEHAPLEFQKSFDKMVRRANILNPRKRRSIMASIIKRNESYSVVYNYIDEMEKKKQKMGNMAYLVKEALKRKAGVENQQNNGLSQQSESI